MHTGSKSNYAGGVGSDYEPDGSAAAATNAQPARVALDRNLIERYVDRVIVKPQAVEVRLMSSGSAAPALATGSCTIPFTASKLGAAQGSVSVLVVSLLGAGFSPRSSAVP